VAVIAEPGDVAEAEFVERLFALAVSRFGRLDLLVNNAGAFDGGPLDRLPVETWDRVLATNLRGPFLCTQAAMRIMKEQRSGRIINIGSISAHRVRPNSAAYSASKHGLWGLTQVTALEGRPHGITCCCLQPGNTLVPHRAASSKPEDAEPMMAPEEIAQVALLMATLPPHVEMLEATVLPREQLYVGRG
jgi:NAD(P)-dependent dehydrogenase (short-subunit alcohol dehydrogenase family)